MALSTMSESQTPNTAVLLSRIFLDIENPRFDENVIKLAEDIVAQGSLNPLELVALLPVKSKGAQKGRRQSYVVAEGNRRVCALKLLTDPDRAPARFRRKIEDLAADWAPIKTVSSIIFEDEQELRIWMKRLHEERNRR